MKTTNEMRELANEVNQRKEELKKEKATKWGESGVQKRIEYIAHQGGFRVVVTIPNFIDSKYAIDFLKENGYSVNLKDRETIEIKW
jgi:hypothetical protein